MKAPALKKFKLASIKALVEMKRVTVQHTGVTAGLLLGLHFAVFFEIIVKNGP